MESTTPTNFWKTFFENMQEERLQDPNIQKTLEKIDFERVLGTVVELVSGNANQENLVGGMTRVMLQEVLETMPEESRSHFPENFVPGMVEQAQTLAQDIMENPQQWLRAAEGFRSTTPQTTMGEILRPMFDLLSPHAVAMAGITCPGMDISSEELISSMSEMI